MSDASVQQQSGLGEVRELERDYTLNEAAELEGCHPNTIRHRAKNKEYETYLDGGIRKITRRSMLARRNRLLQDQTAVSPALPPPPDHVKIAKARAEKRAHYQTPGQARGLPPAAAGHSAAAVAGRVGPTPPSRISGAGPD